MHVHAKLIDSLIEKRPLAYVQPFLLVITSEIAHIEAHVTTLILHNFNLWSAEKNKDNVVVTRAAANEYFLYSSTRPSTLASTRVLVNTGSTLIQAANDE